MGENMNEKLKKILSGMGSDKLKNSADIASKFLSTKEGQKLKNSLKGRSLKWEIVVVVIVKSYGSLFFSYYFSVAVAVIDAAVITNYPRKENVHL